MRLVQFLAYVLSFSEIEWGPIFLWAWRIAITLTLVALTVLHLFERNAL